MQFIQTIIETGNISTPINLLTEELAYRKYCQIYPLMTLDKTRQDVWFSVQGTVDLWPYIMPIDRYSHTLKI